MKKVLLSLCVCGLFLLGCTTVLEPLPTYTPAPPQMIIVTPTPVPESEWFCFDGEVKIVNLPPTEFGRIEIGIVGEQIICARDWHVSETKGPVGYYELNGDKPLTFEELQSRNGKEKGNDND